MASKTEKLDDWLKDFFLMYPNVTANQFMRIKEMQLLANIADDLDRLIMVLDNRLSDRK